MPWWLTEPCRNGQHRRCTAASCECLCRHQPVVEPPTLKPLELAALQLWAKRRTHAQIAGELNYSVDNIKSHLQKARRRWGVASTNALMDAAIAAGFPIR